MIFYYISFFVTFSILLLPRPIYDAMVVLRDGMCPGLDEELIQALRAEDVKTGVFVYSRFSSQTIECTG